MVLLGNLQLSTDTSQSKSVKKLKTSPNDIPEEDLFRPITIKWRHKINQDILLLKLDFEHPSEFTKTTYIKLRNCILKKTISIIPDGNCLYRSISWWLTCKEDFHGFIRTKLVDYMESSSPSKQYIKNKTNESIEEYLARNNTIMSTVWGGDVELFSMAIWLQTDVYVYINDGWDKFSFKGFNPKVGRNIASSQAIYLRNEASHYEPIVSVVRKEIC